MKIDKKDIFKLYLLGLVFLLIAFGIKASNVDFVAISDIAVSPVSFGNGTTSLTIMGSSTASSWSLSDSNLLSIVNPGEIFKISSPDSNVKALYVKIGNYISACATNTVPGVSYVMIPSATTTYSVFPSSDVGCCVNVDHAVSYNAYPTCGAASCVAGYYAANGACLVSNGGGSGGSSGGSSASGVTEPIGAIASTSIATSSVANSTNTSDVIPSNSADDDKESLSSEIKQQKIGSESSDIVSSGNDLDVFLSDSKLKKDIRTQALYMNIFTSSISSFDKTIKTGEKYAINNFVVYGTRSTYGLGIGERAGVVSSYKSAFGRLPKTEDDWQDCIAIANGRWPKMTSQKAVSNAKKEFKKIYKRDAKMNIANDNAAVTIIAYGLRPAKRNTSSEAAATKTFKSLYKKNPALAIDWNVVRAIAYSGAKR